MYLSTQALIDAEPLQVSHTPWGRPLPPYGGLIPGPPGFPPRWHEGRRYGYPQSPDSSQAPGSVGWRIRSRKPQYLRQTCCPAVEVQPYFGPPIWKSLPWLDLLSQMKIALAFGISGMHHCVVAYEKVLVNGDEPAEDAGGASGFYICDCPLSGTNSESLLGS